jgi:hypothetical protein
MRNVSGEAEGVRLTRHDPPMLNCLDIMLRKSHDEKPPDFRCVFDIVDLFAGNPLELLALADGSERRCSLSHAGDRDNQDSQARQCLALSRLRAADFGACDEHAGHEARHPTPVSLVSLRGGGLCRVLRWRAWAAKLAASLLAFTLED